MKFKLNNKNDFKSFAYDSQCPISRKLSLLTGDTYFSEASVSAGCVLRVRDGRPFEILPKRESADLIGDSWEYHDLADDAPYNQLNKHTPNYLDVWDRMYDEYHDKIAKNLFLKYGHIEWEIMDLDA